MCFGGGGDRDDSRGGSRGGYDPGFGPGSKAGRKGGGTAPSGNRGDNADPSGGGKSTGPQTGYSDLDRAAMDALVGQARDAAVGDMPGVDDDFGTDVAGALGFTEMVDAERIQREVDQGFVSPDASNASWGFDPVGALAGAAGMAAGVPGLGVPAAYVSQQLGYPLGRVNLGPSVVGSPDGVPSAQQTAEGNGFATATPTGSRYGGSVGSRLNERAFGNTGRTNPVESARPVEPRWWSGPPVTPAAPPSAPPVSAPAAIGSTAFSNLTPIRLNRFRDPSFYRMPPALFGP